MTNHDNPSDDNGNEPVVLEMAPLDTRRIKTPSALSSPPTEFLIPAGRVVLSWSGVEQSMDQLITRMLVITAQSEPGWQHRNFRKRKDLFRKLVKIAFDKRSFLKSYALGAMDDAATLYWKRNVLTHGKIIMEMGGPTREIRLIATGTHNGKTVSIRMLPDELEQIFYDIAHIDGRLTQFLSESPKVPGASSQDIQFLQDFSQSSRTTAPN
jgi:hypothetical protein